MERMSNVECGELLSIAPRDVDVVDSINISSGTVYLGTSLDDILKMVPWKDSRDISKLVIVVRQ